MGVGGWDLLQGNTTWPVFVRVLCPRAVGFPERGFLTLFVGFPGVSGGFRGFPVKVAHRRDSLRLSKTYTLVKMVAGFPPAELSTIIILKAGMAPGRLPPALGPRAYPFLEFYCHAF